MGDKHTSPFLLRSKWRTGCQSDVEDTRGYNFLAFSIPCLHLGLPGAQEVGQEDVGAHAGGGLHLGGYQHHLVPAACARKVRDKPQGRGQGKRRRTNKDSRAGKVGQSRGQACARAGTWPRGTSKLHVAGRRFQARRAPNTNRKRKSWRWLGLSSQH